MPALGACVSASAPPPPTSSPTKSARNPAPKPVPRVNPTNPAPPSPGFIPPQMMRAPGLENVIGQSASQLERRFGSARLDIAEGDARKLQFKGEPCVLDVYLYPLRPGAQPVATHLEARRASDGRAVDRAACVAALGSSD
ncbi:MAG TPA: hypothetical protein DCS24_04205 [Erythrobacter sp.]|nr:hypothetical protein [Erythrobacter sp.]